MPSKVQVYHCTYFNPVVDLLLVMDCVATLSVGSVQLRIALITVADPGEFHWFPRKPPFKLALIFHSIFNHALINYSC